MVAKTSAYLLSDKHRAFTTYAERIVVLSSRLDRGLSGQGYVFGAIAAIMAIRMIAVSMSGVVYDNASLDPLFWNALALWLVGFALRVWRPNLPVVYMLEATALMLMAAMQTTIATSAIATNGVHYVDPLLAQMDAVIAPWLDWPSMVRMIADHSEIYAILNQAYVSAGWQPLLLVFAVLLFGKVEMAVTFVTAGALSLVVCLGVFAWMPASGAFAYHGITIADVSEIQVSLGFDFLPILEGFKEGAITTINRDNLSGLVSFPSMHASTAVILAIAWARMGKWWGPFIVLNVLMAFSAMPVGNHYFVDVIAGSLLGAASYCLAHRLVSVSFEEPAAATSANILEPSENTARLKSELVPDCSDGHAIRQAA